MTLPAIEMKQLVEKTTLSFDWNKCPEKFREDCKHAVESSRLLLMFTEIKDEEVSCLISFLKCI